MKRIAIMAAMALLLTLNLGGLANGQSGTSSDISDAVSGQFSQAEGLSNLQQSLSNVNGAQRDAIVQSLQSVINQLQSQSSAAAPATHNYGAVNPTGTFRGAYQFSRQTWDWVAGIHHPHLVGVDPAAADPAWQDIMAYTLFDMRGWDQWPVCGLNLL